jgi:protocatechuate 4,5-dioxygenase, alpha chain
MCNGISTISQSSGLPRRGESINRLCRALADPAERREFQRSEAVFCLRFGLDVTARRAIKERDYLRLIELGAHVAQLDHLAALSGLNTLQAIERSIGISASALLGELPRGDS